MAVEENCVDGTERSVAMATNYKSCQQQNGVLAVGHLVMSNGTPNNNNKLPNGVDDDELTSLSWLQDTNLLKNFQMGACGIESEDVLSDTPSSDYLDDTSEPMSLSCDQEDQSADLLSLSNHMPYNPTLHANSKPPYSFSCLIFMAIEDSLNKALPVKDIYNWILNHFPYFQNAPTGWKNSVRHNLSLSKCFRKVEKEKGQNIGKGSLWCIDPEFRPNLMQALHKAPSMANLEFSHFGQLSAPSSPFSQNGKSESDIKPCLLVSSQQSITMPSPELFPYLSRRLASSMKDPEVDAAATMLALKNGPSRTTQNFGDDSEGEFFARGHRRHARKRLRHDLFLKQSSLALAAAGKRAKVVATIPVITSSPSEDHTYSACLSPVQNELDWSDDSKSYTNSSNNNNTLRKPTRFTKDADEMDDSAAEGAHALMNLAEIASKRLQQGQEKCSS